MLDISLQVLQYFFWTLSQPRYEEMLTYLRQVFAEVSEPELGSPRRFLPLPYLHLQVRVLEADGVEIPPSTGTYCTVEVTENRGIVRTSTKENTATPWWNETFDFTLIDAVRSMVHVILWRRKTRTSPPSQRAATKGSTRLQVRGLFRRCLPRCVRDEQIGYTTLHISETPNHSEQWCPVQSAVPGQPLTARVKLGLSLTTGHPVEHQQSSGGIEEHVTIAYIFLCHRMNSKTSNCSIVVPYKTWEEALDDKAIVMLGLHACIRQLRTIEMWYCYLQAVLCAKSRDSECVSSFLVMDLVGLIEDQLKMGYKGPNKASIQRLLKYAYSCGGK